MKATHPQTGADVTNLIVNGDVPVTGWTVTAPESGADTRPVRSC